MLDPDLPPTERAEAGRQINALEGGDPRPGVQDFAWDADYWCRVTGGRFTYQDDPNAEIPYDYWIGKYPITHAQFKLFLADPDGCENAAWWQHLHADALRQRSTGGRQCWHIPNYPAESVNWYECMAFCAWLNGQRHVGRIALPDFIPSNYIIRLLTEQEWEKAARVTDGREYPWGNAYRLGFANINETRDGTGMYSLGQISSVGIYPQGAAPCGALDMAGNVWEWCLAEYESGRVNIDSNARRLARGGAYTARQDIARATERRCYADADHHDKSCGFRIVAAVPLW